jgi:hypothetical protein
LIPLAGCTIAGPWSVDPIIAGDSAFNASRLIYQTDSYAPLTFELLKMGEQIEAFLSLTRYHLPLEEAHIVITINGISIEESLPLHEGGMRVRLPPSITARLIQALQDGQKVGILLDGFEETLDPAQFSPSFAQFLDGPIGLNTLLKGPLS